MYLGRIVEYGSCDEVFSHPLHPYTHSLLKAIPSPTRQEELLRLAGEVPSPMNPPAGCHFHPRCPVYKEGHSCRAKFAELCTSTTPYLAAKHNSHDVACHATEEE
jgi:oligopeptide/dipeptide ABC transporter ATP-binding protein